ncbi:MAG: FG-GAP-like repeat-containing protein [Gemmatimonadota bacterium]|nr:FG-GAP-like repeat-containing protein [Gemmatimonadota bacterium]
MRGTLASVGTSLDDIGHAILRFALRITSALLFPLSVAACERDALPDASSPIYAEAVTSFYRGVAAAQAGESGLAAAAFQRVTELVPKEPAGWANFGLIALQRRELGEAADRLLEARVLAPENSHIQLVSAIVERERGRLDSATALLSRAIELDAQSLKALYLLAQLVEQEGRPGSEAETQQLIDRILAAEPENLVALLERARLAAKLRDIGTLEQTLDRVAVRADSLSLSLTAELQAVRTAEEAEEFDRAATLIGFLHSVLQPLPAYRDDQEAVRTSPSRMDVLLTRFVRLPTPTALSAAPDTGLRFIPETLTVGRGPVSWVRTFWLSDDVPLAMVAASRETLWVSTEPGQAESFTFPGGTSAVPLSSSGVAALDYNYDFLVDLVLAGPGGLRVFSQDRSGSFVDATSRAIAPGVAHAAYAGAWAADLDMEGDLDLVLARVDGPPVALRNRGDGTFEVYRAFEDVTRLRDFVWADLDADGDPDAALLDAAGRLRVFRNGRYRLPQFQPFTLPNAVGSVHAVAAADLNQDATLDLILLGADGGLRRLSMIDDAWDVSELGRWLQFAPANVQSTRLFVADLDNNGDLDVVASTPDGARAWLNTALGIHSLPPIEGQITSVADISGEGRLDLIAVSSDGESRLLVNEGTFDYYSTSIRPRAAEATGDRRINSFGIGGEIEIRAGLLYQKQVIQGPTVHFGTGEAPLVDVARIIWPNGTVQAEFNLAATNETVLTRQRLKGSCPWVFAFDGEAMRFVSDFIWRTALGLRINAQGEAAVIHSEDWIKIRGDQLAARDGVYDVRITADLWETHFFDHVALLVVDHPAGTEVFVDERFTLPAPTPAVHAMQPLRPVAQAWDQTGGDVTALIHERDEQFLDTFELGPYQGIASEHFVEVSLGDDVPTDGPLWLVASGWVYPTDASINVAVTQGDHPVPHGLTLEVPDGKGGWNIVESDLGFPAGKTKTMLIDLEHAFRPGTPRHVRLRTNMEIYWDRISWAVGWPDATITTRRLLPTTAELRYRGFSEVTQASRKAPELPDYSTIATTAPLWRDLVGFYTRFGDVGLLNEAVDDRYVIMNAGDELVLQFPALSPPSDGWTRDFVLIGDGWVKDGDYNTGFSTTVLPLPYHGLADYSRPPGRLQDDPAYRRHPKDWETFHTRYVTARNFHRALAPTHDR